MFIARVKYDFYCMTVFHGQWPMLHVHVYNKCNVIMCTYMHLTARVWFEISVEFR